MTLDDWLAEGRLKRHRASAHEIRNLLTTAGRDIAQAQVVGSSMDWQLIAAYSAALSLATIPLVCRGYRAPGAGHHKTTLETLPLTLGEDTAQLADYLDKCRRIRSEALYERVGVATESEVAQLLKAANELRERVLRWLEEHHPDLVPE